MKTLFRLDCACGASTFRYATGQKDRAKCQDCGQPLRHTAHDGEAETVTPDGRKVRFDRAQERWVTA